MADLVPYSFFKFPNIRNMWDDEDDWLTPNLSSGLSVSEDDKNVYIEAAVPGIDPKDVEVTFDKGVIWIRGEVADEEKEVKKYYRKSSNAFSYRVAVPGDIDPNTEPEAICKNGVI